MTQRTLRHLRQHHRPSEPKLAQVTVRMCPQCGSETMQLTCPKDGFGTVDAALYKRHEPTSLIGEVFQERYRVDTLMGVGGMGAVYRATQLRVGRPVALKVINAELAYDLAVVARFQREGRAIASLIHPNIVQVYDFGQSEEGQLFMAMELVEGRTLGKLIEEEAPIAADRVVRITRQILDALAEAHDRGVIHRDLKPDNIFVTYNGRRHEQVKIVDFGVAKIVNEPQTESMVTARGAIVGSPKYMAPEQARGRGVTGHADLYAVGGIVYEMLSGSAVFEEPSPADYVVAHSVKIPAPPVIDGQPIGGPLVDLVMQLLDKKPWNRPDGASRALELLEAASGTPLLDIGDNLPIHVEVQPEEQDRRPRRLVKNAYRPDEQAPTPMEALLDTPPPVPGGDKGLGRVVPLVLPNTDDGEEGDTRARVVAAGLRPRGSRPATRVLPTTAPRRPTGIAPAASSHDAVQVMGTEVGPAVPASTAPTKTEERSSGLWWLAVAVLLLGAGIAWLVGPGFGNTSTQHSTVEHGHQVGGPSESPTTATTNMSPKPTRRQAAATTLKAAHEVAPLRPAGPSPTSRSEIAAAVAPSVQGIPKAPTATVADRNKGSLAIGETTVVIGEHASANRKTNGPDKSTSLSAVEPNDKRAHDSRKETSKRSGAESTTGEDALKTTRTDLSESRARRKAARIAKAAKAAEAAEAAKAAEAALAAKPAEPAVMREVVIESIPAGVRVELGGQVLGNTPVSVGWRDDGSAFQVRLHKDGYASKTLNLAKLKRDGVTVRLQPTMAADEDGPEG